MTVKLNAFYGAQPPGTLLTTDLATETALVAAGQATFTLTGGTAWPVTPGASSGPGSLSTPQATAVAAQVAVGGFQGPTLFDYARPAGGRGTLVCSWQVNPNQLATSTEAFPEAFTCPQSNTPGVPLTSATGGSISCTADLAADSVQTVNTFTPSLSPVAVAANTTAEQTLTVTGVTTAMVVQSVIKPSVQSGLKIVGWRVTAADTMRFTYQNTTGGSITPTAAETHTINCVTTTQSSNFNTIGIWLKAGVRADGQQYTYARLDLSADSGFINSAITPVTIRADGKWRFYTIPKANFGPAGTFQVGATRWAYVRILERGDALALTLTATPAVGDKSATLNAAFAGTSSIYPLRFSSNEVRNATLTNGSTAVVWDRALTAAATTSVAYCTVRLGTQSGDTIAAGPIYANPAAKAFAFVRFDDGTIDQYVARQQITSGGGGAYVGQSGITIPINTPYSMLGLVQAFGLKANCFVLTRHIGKTNFMTMAQLQDLQNTYGWNICTQTHYNPLNLANAGIRLLGPYGYDYKTSTYGSISGVAANVVTTSSAHQITRATGFAGYQGFPVTLYGSALPASSFNTSTVYWLRETSTTQFTFHLTEDDSINGTNIVTLDVGGTAWDFRYANSTADGSAVGSDLTIAQGILQANGLTGWRHYAPNQGAYDPISEAAINTLRAAGNMRVVSGIFGSTGTLDSAFFPRVANGAVGFGTGTAASKQFNTSGAEWMTCPVAIATESVTEANIRLAVDNAIQTGSVIGNYQHFMSTETTMRQLIAYLDHIRLRVNQGLLLTGTMDDLYAYLSNTGTA